MCKFHDQTIQLPILGFFAEIQHLDSKLPFARVGVPFGNPSWMGCPIDLHEVALLIGRKVTYLKYRVQMPGGDGRLITGIRKLADKAAILAQLFSEP